MTKSIDLQTVFDNAVNGMREQAAFSVSNGFCQYRSEGGKKCAIGFSIPDKKYSGSMEGSCGSVVLNEIFFLNPSLWSTVKEMQGCLHDNLFSRAESLDEINPKFNSNAFEREAAAFAKRHDLVYNPPEAP